MPAPGDPLTNRATAATISSTLASPSLCSKLSRRHRRVWPSNRPTPTALRTAVTELSCVKATACVCEHFVCRLTVTEPEMPASRLSRGS